MKSLMDISEKISDGIHTTPKYVDSSEYYFINGNNLKNNKILISEKTKCVSYDEYLKYKKELGNNTILLSINGTIGNLAFYKDEKVILGKSAAYIILKNTIDKYFIINYLAGSKIKNYFISELTGSTIRNLSIKSIKQTKINLPSYLEQKKIANILSTWDKAIDVTERLIESSKAQKRALMQQLLTGKKRLKGFNKRWKYYSIKQMGNTVSGGTPDTTKDEYWNGNISWATPTDITALNNRYIFNTKRKITIDGVKNSSANILPINSLLVCTRATVGYMAVSSNEITTNQGFKSLTPNNNFNVDYLYYLFTYYKNLFIRYACGSTFLELSKKDFSKLKYLCPNIEEQQKIAAIFSAADKEIELLQQKLSFLVQEKKALMQQLLTGKRRVKVSAKTS